MIQLQTMLLSASIAGITVLLQVWLKLLSRRPRYGKWHALTLEDALWWIDWVVAGSLALAIFVVAAAGNRKEIEIYQMVTTILTLLFGYSVMPYLVKLLAYKQSGELRGWKHVVLANVFGSLVLFSAVAAGAKING